LTSRAFPKKEAIPIGTAYLSVHSRRRDIEVLVTPFNRWKSPFGTTAATAEAAAKLKEPPRNINQIFFLQKKFKPQRQESVFIDSGLAERPWQ
jgi:hypothetical protein